MPEMDHMVRVYVGEARELLDELERALLALEADPTDQERIAACFRAMHTIKGGAGMFGFEEIARFTHAVETVFELVRTGALSVSKTLLSLTLEARDHILALLDAPFETDSSLRGATDALLERFHAFLGAEGQGAVQGAGGPGLSGEGPGGMPWPEGESPNSGKPWLGGRRPASAGSHAPGFSPSGSVALPIGLCWVRFRPAPDILHTGNDPLRLLTELDGLGEMRVRHGGELPPPLGDPAYDPERLYGYFDILLLTQSDANTLRDVFIFVEDQCELTINRLHDGRCRTSDLDDLLALLAGMDDDHQAGECLRKALETRSMAQQTAKPDVRPKSAPGAGKSAEQGGAASLRVDSAKLDILVGMAGEMVILQSRLHQAVKAGDMDAVAAVDEDLERLTDGMREVSLGLRMLPIGTVFSVFQRLVRDLSGTLSKEVDFVTSGGETELDKTILDQLKDPLIHILRNSLDHGLELPDEREAAGKPRRGTITLAASHGGGMVEIVVSDNGRGIDTQAVRQKALEQGLITSDAALAEKDILALLFAPGFSTAKQVSDISGRGVGMDVVQRNIAALRGTVDLESRLGQGARVVIRLPLTLAIIDGFNVMVGAESFIVPLSHLRGFQERFVTGQVNTVETFERMGNMIPLISLRGIFDVPGERPEYERIVITDVEGELVGLSVDKVVGRQQAVIKSLDECYRSINWISGTTINGDGSISLILDIPRLVRMARDNG